MSAVIRTLDESIPRCRRCHGRLLDLHWRVVGAQAWEHTLCEDDRALLARVAALAQAVPTDSAIDWVVEGAASGYPPCCVHAFAVLVPHLRADHADVRCYWDLTKQVDHDEWIPCPTHLASLLRTRGRR